MDNALESIQDLLSTTDNLSEDANNLKILLNRIEENLKSSDCSFGLESKIIILFGHDEGKSVIAFIETCLKIPSKKQYVVEFFKFMEDLCMLYPKSLANHVSKMVNIALLSVTKGVSNLQEHGYNLISTVIQKCDGLSDYNFSDIYKSLKDQIDLEGLKVPKVALAFFELVGVLCRFHPDSIGSEKVFLFKEAVYMLVKEMRSNNPAHLVMEGCFVAINGLLLLFTTEELKELSTELNRIYSCMKSLFNPENDRSRHTTHRAALSIIEHHSGKISDLLKRDYSFWHNELKKWTEHNNKDDKEISKRAQNAFLRQMAKVLASESLEEADRNNMLQFFMAYLRNKLLDAKTENFTAAVGLIGVFAPAFGLPTIEKIFEDVVLKIDIVFPQNDNDSSIFYLSEYLGALAALACCLKENLKQHHVDTLERISVKLISACNTLSSDRLDAAVDSIAACCITALEAGGTLGLKNFINVIVYQGIIKACCQQPIVKQLTKSDFEETTSFKVVVDDYLPFWEKLLSIHKKLSVEDEGIVESKKTIVEFVYEAIIESIVKMINNLDVNFEESNFDEAAITESTNGLKANNDADMAIVMNLDFLFSKLLPKIEISLHEKCISSLLRNLTAVSTQNPLLPSYYKLLATVLSIADKLEFFENDNNKFEDRDMCQQEINYYIGDLLVNLHHYHKDVQEACLRVITSSSVELIASHLQQLPAAFEVLFHIGRSDLELSSMGVSALDRWMSKLNREQLTPFFKQVIPHLYVFLDNRRIKVAFPEEFTEYAQSAGSRRSKRRKLVDQLRIETSLGETQLARLQLSILQLLGRLDMTSLLSLLDQDYSDVVMAWSRKPVVTWLMKFREVNVPVDLDVFAPRAMEIALQSSDPANKDASFELLHAIFIIYLVKTSTHEDITDDHKQFFKKMLQGMFKLGCKTSDAVGRNIFSNLLYQTCHWCTKKKVNRKMIDIFVDSMLEALTCPSDIEVRELAAECLHEYVSWTLKPTDRSPSEVAREIEYIITKIAGYCDHPCPFKRQGAAMGFNQTYRQLREQDWIVDRYWLELFAAFVKSLLLPPHPSREVFVALDHLCRVMVEKADSFNMFKETRRRPLEFEGVLLKDAVKWLLTKCNNSNEKCRDKCMRLVDKLVVKVEGNNNLLDFIETENIDIPEICQIQISSNEMLTSMRYLLLWMNRLSAAIHVLKWLRGSGIDIVSAVGKNESSCFLESVNNYIKKISSCSAGSIKWLADNSNPFCPQLATIDAYDRSRRQVTLNLLSFFASLEEDLIEMTNYLLNGFWQWLSRCLVEPALIGFTTVSQNQLNKLRSVLSQLLMKLQQHLGNIVLKQNFVRPTMSRLQDNEKGHFVTSLSKVMNRHPISDELNFINALIVLKQINLLDADDQDLIENETLWNSCNLIQAISNCLVEESGRAIIPQKSHKLYLELLLDFAFLLQTENNVSKLIEIMCDETLLKEDDDESKNATKGQHFTNTLHEKIFAHLCNFPLESVNELLKYFKNFETLGNLEKIFEFISKCLCTLLDRCKKCEDSVKLNIATSIDNDFPRVPGELLDPAINLVYSVHNFLPGHNIKKSKLDTIFNFLSKGLRSYDYFTKYRARILKAFLQISIVDNGTTNEESDEELRKTLTIFIDKNIKTSSKDWGGNTDFCKEVFNILLEMLKRTGNKVLMLVISQAIANDPAHPFREKFKSIIGQSRAIPNNSVAILDELYEAREKILKPHNRVKFVQDSMLPIIQNTSSKLAEQFFLKRIKDIVDKLKENQTNIKINSLNLETLVPTRAAAMLLIGELFSKFPSSELTSVTSSIVKKSEEIDKDSNAAVLLRTCTARVRFYLEEELNKDVKDNLKDGTYDLYLSYKQIAFNTLVSLISNTKRDVKSFQFYGLIFKNVKFIMPRELISISNMTFDEIPKRKQAQISIRRAEKRKRRHSTTSIDSYQLFTLSVDNSTFADDMRRYDRSNGIMRESYQPPNQCENTDQMKLELEVDDLNSHPCMAWLCGVVMTLHEITRENSSTSEAVPKVDDEAPVWIKCISNALKSSANEPSNEEINAKLLLIKLLHNCNETNPNIFTPYAEHLLSHIIKFVIENRKKCFGNSMNYMIGDILGMLTSWSSVITPKSNEINQLLSFMIEKTPHDRKDVLKLNIETVKTVITSWKDGISTIPHDKILDFLSDIDQSKIRTSLEIICCLIINNIKPYAEDNLDKFYENLEKQVLSKDRNIRHKSAEILGMLYRFLSDREGSSPSSIEEKFDLANLTRKISLDAHKNGNSGKTDTMILFTSLMKNHYPRIVTYFVKDTVRLISAVQETNLQQHLLDIVNTALKHDNINEKQYPEEFYIDVSFQLIKVFRLGTVANQEIALNVILALRDFLEYDNLAELLLEVVKHFRNHTSLPCRKAYYDVLINIHEYYQITPCAGNIEVPMSGTEKLFAKDLVRNALVTGMEDSNEEIRNKLFEFWNKDGRVRTDLVDRLEDLFKLLYSPDRESSFLSLFLQLMLNVCRLNPDYYSCVLPDDGDRSTDPEKILDMKQSRVNSVASVAPILVRTVTTERKSSYSSYGSSLGSVARAMGSQQSLQFQPTVNTDEPSIPSVGSSSLHSFTHDTTVSLHGKRSHTVNDNDNDDDDVDFKVPFSKTRRLQSDKNKIGQSAAYMNLRRNQAMQTELQEHKSKQESAVHLTRTYSHGDLPDRNLTNENLVVCLLKFAKKDMTIASQLMASLLKGIINGYKKKSSEPHNQDQTEQLLRKLVRTIDEALKRIMSETKQATRGVISVVLDTCFKFANELSSSKCIDELYDVSNRSGLHSLGALVLENSLSSSLVSHDESNIWVYLARLYRSLGFDEIVQGIFEEKLAKDDVREALEAEAAGQLKRASTKYQSIAGDLQNGKVDEQGDFVYEAYFNCMARMGDWDVLKKAITDVSDVDEMWSDSWSKENLLPWFLKAGMMSSDTSYYENRMKVWLHDREKLDYIKTNIGEELSMFYLMNTKSFDRALEVSQNNRKLFLEDWMQLPALSHNLIMDKCLKLQRLMDIESSLAVLSASRLKKSDWFPKCIDLLQKWESNPPMKGDSLSHWEIRTKYRTHFCGTILKMWNNREISRFESSYNLSLLDLALNHENGFLAKGVLKKVDKKQPMYIPEKSRTELLFATIYETRNSKKMLEYVASSWQTINSMNFDDPKLDLQVILISQKHVTEICSTLQSFVSKNINNQENLESFNVLFQDKFPDINVSDSACVLKKLYETGLESLKKSVQTAEKMVGMNLLNSNSDLAETYLTLAKYCQQQTDGNLTVESKMIESLLRAMKLGSKEARHLFPIILSLPSLDQSHSTVFTEECKEVPTWMFLSWADQMLARVDTEIGVALEPVLLRLATEYPSALKYPLNIRSTEYTTPAARNIINKLKSLAPFDSLTSNFVEAIKFVILPGTLLLNCLMSILKSIQCKESERDVQTKWIELETFMDELFSKESLKYKNINIESNLRELLLKPPLNYHVDSYKLFRQTLDAVKLLESERKSYKKSTLSSFSKWFDSYQSSPHRIEIPGQYSGDNMPIPDKIVKISKFCDRISVMSSLRKPVKMSVIGNDGVEYGFLVKQGEDLRQDQRIMQALRLMDSLLKLDNANSTVMKYSLKTYNVIPFTSNLGLLSWVDESTSLQDFISSCLEKNQKDIYEKTENRYRNWLPSGVSQKHQYQRLYCDVSRSVAVANFRENVKSLPQDILRRGILELSQSAESYHYLRTQLGGSLSAMSVCHWLMGIGDRHLDNTLLCVNSGQLCGIDFGHAFGSATALLSIPELLPFRLTPQLLNLFEPFRATGLIKESMCRCLEILRKRKLLIMASIEVFIHDPLADWAQQAKFSAIINDIDISGIDYNSKSRERIERARKKLDGANPVAVMTEDLESGHAGKEYLAPLKSMVAGENAGENQVAGVRSSKPDHGLTVREQVECLIDLATDEHILGKSFIGLRTWV